jgi:hypothetical protein
MKLCFGQTWTAGGWLFSWGHLATIMRIETSETLEFVCYFFGT